MVNALNDPSSINLFSVERTRASNRKPSSSPATPLVPTPSSSRPGSTSHSQHQQPPATAVSATDLLIGTSLNLFPPHSHLRQLSHSVSTHPIFEYFILACVLLNVITLALDSPSLDKKVSTDSRVYIPIESSITNNNTNPKQNI
jgi:hypothetical protein